MEGYQLLATKVYEAFSDAYDNSHADVNRDNTVEYPYITYNIRTNPADARNQENLIIDVQLFDNTTSYSRIYEVASMLKNHFKGLIMLAGDLDIRFDVQRGASNWISVPTADDSIIRLEGNIQGKIDWREK